MKKLLIVLIAILSLSVCLFGCFDKRGESTSEGGESILEEENGEEQTVAFIDKSINLEIYESLELVVAGADREGLIWRSSNPEKLTVDQNGVVFGKMAGTVTVYVSDGKNEASCIVTVIDSGFLPMLNVSLPEEFRLNVGDKYNLSPYITYNGKKYYNAEYTFTATGCVSVSKDGVVTANSVGGGVVTVVAEWNGVQSKALTVEIEISVI